MWVNCWDRNSIIKKKIIMTDKMIKNTNQICDDWFRLDYTKIDGRGKPLQYYLLQFNPEDYWIYKQTSVFREVSVSDFFEFKYAGYIFFHKSKYSNIEINKSIKKINDSIFKNLKYFSKPLPSIDILNKIKVINPIV